MEAKQETANVPEPGVAHDDQNMGLLLKKLIDLDINSTQANKENADPKTTNDRTLDKSPEETFDILLSKLQAGVDARSQAVQATNSKVKVIRDGIPASFKTIEDPQSAIDYAKSNLADTERVLTSIAEGLSRTNKMVTGLTRMKENLEFTQKVPKENPDKYGALIHSIDHMAEHAYEAKDLLADMMTRLISNKDALIAMIKKHEPSWEDKQTTPVKDSKSAFATEDEKKQASPSPAVSPAQGK
ncbi:hypothetical protein N7493_003654 [Penicillium malachiteum]|uniref:Uncharacterized protein n=1 Tax=Penicillium malachiteum TaxID=1324776 RepID=A0AAD6HR24_9EURO|nr:hypothetical protein N7493_003654 [Penicillium malachiteum]